MGQLVSACVKRESEGEGEGGGRRDESLRPLDVQSQHAMAKRGLSMAPQGPLDINALLQHENPHGSETCHAPLNLAALEAQLAHNPHAILVVYPTKVAAAVAHTPPGDGLHEHKAASKSTKHLANHMDSYISMVQRLQQVAASAKRNKDRTHSIQQLEALKKKQAVGHMGTHEHQARLALLHANGVAHAVLGGAEGISSWVDVHISQNPMLLSQLKGSEHEVYNHFIPAPAHQQLKGELLQLDVVLCHIHKGEEEAGTALIIGLHLTEQDIQPYEVSVQFGLQQQQQQQPAQKLGMLLSRSQRARSMDLPAGQLMGQPGLNSKNVSMGRSSTSTQQHQQQQQQHLYLALSHLPVAVTLINSSGRITWQNGRSAELLGLLSSKSGSRSEAGLSLQQMFVLDPEALESLLLALKEGEAWNGLVQVPAMEQLTTDSAIKVESVQSNAGREQVQAGSEEKSKREGHANEECYEGTFSGKQACPDVSLPGSAFSKQTQNRQLDLASHGSGPGIGPTWPPGGSAADPASERPSVFSFPESLAGQSSEPQSLGLPTAFLPILELPAEDARDGPKSSSSLHNDEQSAGVGKLGSKIQSATKTEEHHSLPTPFGRSSLRAKSCQWPQHQTEATQKEEPTRPSGLRTSSCVFPAHMQTQLARRPASGLSPASPHGLSVGGLSTSQIPDYAFKDGLGEAPLPHSRARALGRDGTTCPQLDIKSTSPVGSRRGRRRSVHTSGALIFQDKAFSGASRALQMSSSNAQIPPHMSPPPFDKSSVGVETCSLNWLAQGNAGNEGFLTSGACSQPSHYFESIPEGRQNSKVAPTFQGDPSKNQLLETIIDSKAVDRISLGMAAAALQPIPGKSQAGSLPPLQLSIGRGQSASASLPAVPLSASTRNAKGSMDDANSTKNSGSREHSAWSSCQVDEATPEMALPRPSRSPGHPRGQAAAGFAEPSLNHATSLNQTSVHSGMEGSIMAPEHSWHYIDAYNIKGPDGEKLTVLTNQDVTYLVETQISLKQILDVEHKILEDIFPRHVLEGQMAAVAGLSRSLQDMGPPLPCSSRRQSNGSHLSSTTTGRLPSVPNLREEKGLEDASPTWRGGASSPLPHPRQPFKNDMLPLQESSHLHQLYFANSGSHSTVGDGRVHGLLTAPSLPNSQGQKSSDQHEGAFKFESAGLLRMRNSEGLPSALGRPSTQGLGSANNAASSINNALQERANGSSNNRKDPVKGPLGRCRAPPRRNQSCSTIITASARTNSLQLSLDYGSGPNSARSALAPIAPKPTLTGMGRHHENVTVMFVDIKNFTAMSRAISSAEVMHFLHMLFSRFDALVDSKEELGLYKVETIGDCYMCAAGLLTRAEDGTMVLWDGKRDSGGSPVHHMFALAKEMLEVAHTTEMPASGGQPVVLRIGMHTGPVTSGIAGRKCPRFCLFGETVNFAARMESACNPGMVHVSQATWEALGSPDQTDDPHWSRSPGVEAKGIGFVQTYLWGPIPKTDQGGGMEVETVKHA